MDDELAAVVEILNGMLPDQGLAVALILDDAGESVRADLLAHEPLGHVVFAVADRAGVCIRALAHHEADAALTAGKLRHLVLLVHGVDGLAADGALGGCALALVKDHVVAAVGALAAGQLVRADVDGVAAGAVDLFARKESGARFRVFAAVWAFDYEFRHW